MNYEEMSVTRLRELAKEKDIKKVSSLKKQELIDALLELESLTKAMPEEKKTVEKKSTEKKTTEKKAAPEKKALEKMTEASDRNAEAKRQALQELKKATELREARSIQPAGSSSASTGQQPANRAAAPAGQQPVNRAAAPAGQQPVNRAAASAGQQPVNRAAASAAQQPANRAAAPAGQQPVNRVAAPAAQQPVNRVAAPAGQQPVNRSAAPAGQQPLNRPVQSRPGSAQPGVKVVYNNAQPASGPKPDTTSIQDAEVNPKSFLSPEAEMLDSGEIKEGIFELCSDGYGFIRCDNFLPGENDVYVSPAQIRKFNLKTGDIIAGNTKIKSQGEKYAALLYVKTVNGRHPSEAQKRPRFEELTPVFPHERIHLETPGCSPAMRIVDILSPIGKGQRGMIVSQPKAGKTTLLKQIAKAITVNHPNIHLIILLVDERPEEVTDMKESIGGGNVEVIYSTFDELPENHKRVSEMVIERAKRLVEHKQDVVILLDSITRLARAYNLTCASSGRTLSGGLDPAALHMPKKFFGAARCMREGGSLTILSTALVDTGSRMDDVVFEEFKGTGNMELVLDRNLSEKRIFPAIDLPRSSTRRDDLLLSATEQECNEILRHAFNSSKSDSAVEKIINMFSSTKNNNEFCEMVKKTKLM